VKLLDLFCGAGGAAKGYADAGFEVIGVDWKPQPNYPFQFIQADVLTLLTDGNHPDYDGWYAFDAIHASPPCQAFSTQSQFRHKHPRLIAEVHWLLSTTGLPYIIENVEGARSELIDPVRLCGSSFGMDIRRHRLFETNWPLTVPPCAHSWQTPRFRSLRMNIVREGRLSPVVGVHGHLNYPGEFPIRCKAMGIDWMTNRELVQAIPPRYTEYIGQRLAEYLAVTPLA
jgi:DNA (cytosine-5)-methyltransferase 1